MANEGEETLEETIGRLAAEGTAVRRYTLKKTEQKTMCISRETMHIMWTKQDDGKNIFDGTVDIRTIKEIRPGKTSEDFWSKDTSELDERQCLVVMFGKEFNLKSLSVFFNSVEDQKMWVKALNYLVEEAKNASYGLKRSWCLRKCFEETKTPGKDNITLLELKKIMKKVNCKIAMSTLKEQVRQERPGEITYVDFSKFVQELENTELFQDHFKKYSKDSERVTLLEFSQFRRDQEEQGMKEEIETVASIMRDFLKDTRRDEAEAGEEPYFLVGEFMDYLFSSSNQILTDRTRKVHHDMTQPLSRYFVASSHNTFLTGDQLISESSTEAYARCLMMGCRCVEIDCWNGYPWEEQEEDPVIHVYHGNTLTSKIKFQDVIETINRTAFVKSDYPVIISIENHCSLPQQRKMAKVLTDVFGDRLYKAPKDNETTLPSPEDLKEKIILKDKKPPEEDEENKDIQLKGKLDIKINEEWRTHFVVLTSHTLEYSEDLGKADGGESVDQVEVPGDNQLDEDSPHFSQTWFDPDLNRRTAIERLNTPGNLGDGTFLVRLREVIPSVPISIAPYILSFRHGNKLHHVSINYHQEESKYSLSDKILLTDQMHCDSLNDLVTHYQSHPFKFRNGPTMSLKEPALSDNQDMEEPWYHPNASSANAEDMLSPLKAMDGVFLVRPEDGSLEISFTAENKVKHCQIKKEGRLYKIGTTQKGSLTELITHYKEKPLYGKVRLRLGWSQDNIDNQANFAQLEVDNNPLENLQKGSVEITGAKVEVDGCEITVRRQRFNEETKLKAETAEKAKKWADKIEAAAKDASKKEVESGISQDLTDLIYCKTVKMDKERKDKVERKESGKFYEMYSFSEIQAEKIFTEMPDKMSWYHKTQLSRVYPKNTAFWSENYSPLPMWAVDSQIIALNYQTGDKPMQLNLAKFIDNNNCGYLLQPQSTFPEEEASVAAVRVEPLSLKVRVLSARHLPSPGGVFAWPYVSPFVEVEVCSAEDQNDKFETRTITDNGFNPVFNEVFTLKVVDPDMALLRFCVYDVDMFKDRIFLGQATFPVNCLQNGFRSIQLKNKYSEDLDLSTLLVQLEGCPPTLGSEDEATD